MIETTYNLATVVTLMLLGYMMDKMTNRAPDDFTEPVMQTEVAFFVRLASSKLLHQHLVSEEESKPLHSPVPPNNS